jgi:hypothetical protein
LGLRIGGYENEEKRLFYSGLRILLPINSVVRDRKSKKILLDQDRRNNKIYTENVGLKGPNTLRQNS